MPLWASCRIWKKPMQKLADLCTSRRTVTSLSAAHAAKTSHLDQTTSERQSGARRPDGLWRRGLRGRRRATCFAGGGVRVRTGLWTQQMADTSAHLEVKRLTQTSPGGGEVS